MKTQSIVYWTMTILVAFFIGSGGGAQVAQSLGNPHASCAAVGGYGAYGFHVIAPLIITGFCVASWALRPESRKIGVLFPARNGIVV